MHACDMASNCKRKPLLEHLVDTLTYALQTANLSTEGINTTPTNIEHLFHNIHCPFDSFL